MATRSAQSFPSTASVVALPDITLRVRSRPGYETLKRTIDTLGALVLLIALLPAFLCIAVGVVVDSGWPIFYRGERIGRGARTFTVLKFRSMRADSDSSAHREYLSQLLAGEAGASNGLFKVPNDPRITPLGHWLRRTSLDELPQLVNVLRGEMSLVGPRPPLPSEVALYGDHHYARFDVKPGMTGPWQVAGRNGVTAFEEVIGLETAYIQNWSVWADLKLLLRTVPVVVRMDGAF